jgi:hypothetical protein
LNVARAYGWEWPLSRDEILERLVELHDHRVQEESTGSVKWIRPDYQRPLYSVAQGEQPLVAGEDGPQTDAVIMEWPSSVIEQIRALQQVIASSPLTVEAAARTFRGARKDLVERHLQTLVLMGELRVSPDGTYSTTPTV